MLRCVVFVMLYCAVLCCSVEGTEAMVECCLFQYKEYEQVVVEDRIEKEKARRKLEQEAIELRACIRVRVVCPGVRL